jgi:hypothetical protein
VPDPIASSPQRGDFKEQTGKGNQTARKNRATGHGPMRRNFRILALVNKFIDLDGEARHSFEGETATSQKMIGVMGITFWVSWTAYLNAFRYVTRDTTVQRLAEKCAGRNRPSFLI